MDSQQAQQDNLLCLFLYHFIPCLALWEGWLSAAKTERGNNGHAKWIFVVCAYKLISSFKKDCTTLSVTCGDSSPKGRAKGCTSLHSILA